MPPSNASIDSRVFRDTAGCFATGVCIISVKDGDEMHGMTVNSFTSVSLDPPLILVCFNRNTRTEAAVHAQRRFAVNILREDQADLSNRFARPGEDHYAGLAVTLEAGVPLLPACLAYMVCSVVNIYLQGDHSIVVAAVTQAVPGKGTPLLFFRGKYHGMGGTAGRAEDWYW